MVRVALALLLVGGCNQVFPLEQPEPTGCGPYGEPVEQTFAASLEDPSDFSVAADGSTGLVRARYQAPGAAAALTGPIPIKLVAGVWEPDDAPKRQTGLITGTALERGHMMFRGDVFGSSIRTSPSEIRHASFSTDWLSDIAPVVSDAERLLRAGNEIEIVNNEGQILKILVVLGVPLDGEGKNEITILQQPPLATAFTPTEEASRLTARSNVNVTGAVLTIDHRYLVYAATVDEGESHLFISERVKNRFDHGLALRSISQSGGSRTGDAQAGGETEPWISPDCATIYFRRDGRTFRADAVVDDPGSDQ